MSRRASLLVGGMLLLLAQPVWAKTIWAIWDLDLAGHAPPTNFVLTVTSPSGIAVPPAMIVPWAACTQVPGVTPLSHCAPIGCPPTGSYVFQVQAQYTEGLSGPSNLATCTIPVNSAVCDCTSGAVAPPPPPPPPVVVTPPPPPSLITTPPPLPQQTAEGLNLLPVGAIPALPTVPPMPQSAAT
jgi:hypothetical protein